MREKKGCPSSSSLNDASPLSSPSSLSTSFISMYTASPPRPPSHSPAKPLCHNNAHTIQHCTHPSSPPFPIKKLPFRKASSSKWLTKFFKLGKLSMEAEEGFLLQQRALEGLHDQSNLSEKPKKELRFAAKIAVAMDADGFIGVKNSVCADDAPVEVKHNIQTHYCLPSPSTSLQRNEMPAPKQARPRRRWKLFRRIRRTRVLFACLFQKVRKAFACSSKRRTLEAHNKFIKG